MTTWARLVRSPDQWSGPSTPRRWTVRGQKRRNDKLRVFPLNHLIFHRDIQPPVPSFYFLFSRNMKFWRGGAGPCKMAFKFNSGAFHSNDAHGRHIFIYIATRTWAFHELRFRTSGVWFCTYCARMCPALLSMRNRAQHQSSRMVAGFPFAAGLYIAQTCHRIDRLDCCCWRWWWQWWKLEYPQVIRTAIIFWFASALGEEVNMPCN
jgi:hypothetical protein